MTLKNCPLLDVSKSHLQHCTLYLNWVTSTSPNLQCEAEVFEFSNSTHPPLVCSLHSYEGLAQFAATKQITSPQTRVLKEEAPSQTEVCSVLSHISRQKPGLCQNVSVKEHAASRHCISCSYVHFLPSPVTLVLEKDSAVVFLSLKPHRLRNPAPTT